MVEMIKKIVAVVAFVAASVLIGAPVAAAAPAHSSHHFTCAGCAGVFE